MTFDRIAFKLRVRPSEKPLIEEVKANPHDKIPVQVFAGMAGKGSLQLTGELRLTLQELTVLQTALRPFLPDEKEERET